MSANSKNLVKTGIFLVIIIVLGKLFSFVRQYLVAGFFGADSTTDLYFLADSTITMFGGMISAGLTTAILVYYNRLKQDTGALKSFASNWFSLSALIVVAVSIFAFVASPLLSQIYVSETSSEYPTLLYFMRVLSCSLIFITLSTIWSVFLEGENIFVPAKLQSIIVSIVIIAIILFLHEIGIAAVLYAFITAYAIYFVYIIVCLQRRKLIKFSIPKIDANVKGVIAMGIPTMLSTIIVDFNHLVDKYLAVNLDSGDVSILYYCQVLCIDLIASVFIISINAIIVNKFTMYATANDQENLIRILKRIIRSVSLLTVFVTIIFFFFSADITKIFFSIGKLSGADLGKMSSVISLYAISLCFIPVREVLNRVHFAYTDTRRPFIISAISITINILLSVSLAPAYGVNGIAVATSVSIILSTIITWSSTKKHIDKLRVEVKPIFKLTIPALLIIVTSFVVKLVFPEAGISRFIVGLLTAAITYLLVAYMLRNEELVVCFDAIKKIKNKK